MKMKSVLLDSRKQADIRKHLLLVFCKLENGDYGYYRYDKSVENSISYDTREIIEKVLTRELDIDCEMSCNLIDELVKDYNAWRVVLRCSFKQQWESKERLIKAFCMRAEEYLIHSDADIRHRGAEILGELDDGSKKERLLQAIKQEQDKRTLTAMKQALGEIECRLAEKKPVLQTGLECDA